MVELLIHKVLVTCRMSREITENLKIENSVPYNVYVFTHMHTYAHTHAHSGSPHLNIKQPP